MSLSDDASLRGRPRGFRLKVNELRISAAGFVRSSRQHRHHAAAKVPRRAHQVSPSGRATG
jgi:hypothetical protein